MSKFLTELSEKYQLQNEDEAMNFAFDYFNRSSKPFDDLIDNLLQLSESDNNIELINFLIQLFIQWKNQFNKTLSNQKFDEIKMNNFICKSLPLESLNNFIEIFQISKEYLINLLKSSLNLPTNSLIYKRTLNIIVKLNYQLEFQLNELLLPLIINSKDYLIDVYLNKNLQYEEYLLDLLNHLYENFGKNLREILVKEYNIKNPIFNKKTLSKLAVRYWNLYGNEQNEKYPNLAILQRKRTLGYLINNKYTGNNDEKTMSDECWNELVEVNKKRKYEFTFFFINVLFKDIVKEDENLSEYLIEILADKDDIIAVKYWSKI